MNVVSIITCKLLLQGKLKLPPVEQNSTHHTRLYGRTRPRSHMPKVLCDLKRQTYSIKKCFTTQIGIISGKQLSLLVQFQAVSGSLEFVNQASHSKQATSLKYHIVLLATVIGVEYFGSNTSCGRNTSRPP